MKLTIKEIDILTAALDSMTHEPEQKFLRVRLNNERSKLENEGEK